MWCHTLKLFWCPVLFSRYLLLTAVRKQDIVLGQYFAWLTILVLMLSDMVLLFCYQLLNWAPLEVLDVYYVFFDISA